MDNELLYNKYLRFLHHPQGYLTDKELKERKKVKKEVKKLWSVRVHEC